MSAAQDPGLRRELRALGLGDDARRSSSFRAPAPLAEAPRRDSNRAGARREPSPVLPSRRRRQRRRRRRRQRRRLSWQQWWQRQKKRRKKRQKRSLSRRASIQKSRSPKDKGWPEAVGVALGSPPQPSLLSPLPGPRRKVKHPKPRHRRRKGRKIMELENFMANNLLLKARQGGCIPGS